MKIKWKFANGDVSEVEVSEEIGAVIVDSRKAEHAQQEKERYHCYSLDAIDYESSEFGYLEDYGEADEESKRRREVIQSGFERLTETQKRRLLLYLSGKTLCQIAELEGTSFQSVNESIKAAQKKFQKNFGRLP